MFEFFFRIFCGPRRSRDLYIYKYIFIYVKKGTWLMSTHLEQTRLVNKGFITVQKYFALLRIENGLITSIAGKERQLRL